MSSSSSDPSPLPRAASPADPPAGAGGAKKKWRGFKNCPACDKLHGGARKTCDVCGFVFKVKTKGQHGDGSAAGGMSSAGADRSAEKKAKLSSTSSAPDSAAMLSQVDVSATAGDGGQRGAVAPAMERAFSSHFGGGKSAAAPFSAIHMGGGVNTSAALAPDIAMLAAVAAATAGGGAKHSAGPNSSSHASTTGSIAGTSVGTSASTSGTSTSTGINASTSTSASSSSSTSSSTGASASASTGAHNNTNASANANANTSYASSASGTGSDSRASDLLNISSLSGAHTWAHTSKPRRRRKKCGECTGCVLTENCGKCRYCLDKPMYGGPGTMKRACALRQCLNLRELSLSSSQKGGSSSGAGASFAHYPRFVNEEDLSDGDESDFVPEDETLMVDFVLEHTDVAEETVTVADAHVPLSHVDLPPAPVAISTAAYEKILKSGKTLPEILRTRWTDVAIKQLAKWRRKDTYGYFHAPVPLEYVPDYLTVIKTPMDFGTMETRLDEGLYADYEAFASDFRLICQNAMLYNGPKSPYHKVAKSLLGVGNRAITAAIARQDIYTTRLTQEKKEYDRIAQENKDAAALSSSSYSASSSSNASITITFGGEGAKIKIEPGAPISPPSPPPPPPPPKPVSPAVLHVRRMPSVIECVSFVWLAGKRLGLEERDISLDGFERGIADPANPETGAELSLLMSRLVINQNMLSVESSSEATGKTISKKQKQAKRKRKREIEKEMAELSLALPYSWWGPRLVALVNGWYEKFAAAKSCLASVRCEVDDHHSATAAAISAFAKVETLKELRRKDEDEDEESDDDNSSKRSGRRKKLSGGGSGGGPSSVNDIYKSIKNNINSNNNQVETIKTMSNLRSFSTVTGANGSLYNPLDESMWDPLEKFSAVPATARGVDRIGLPRKQKRCRSCYGCLRDDCGKCRQCKDMTKFGGPGHLRQACVKRQCERISYGTGGRPDGRSGKSDSMWDLGGEGSRIDASAHALADLRDTEDLGEYKAALLKLTRKQLIEEVEMWKVHLESMRVNNPMQMHATDDKSVKDVSTGDCKLEEPPSSYTSPFAGNKTFRDVSLRVRVDVVLSVCHFRFDRDLEVTYRLRDHGLRELRNKPVGIDWKSRTWWHFPHLPGGAARIYVSPEPIFAYKPLPPRRHLAKTTTRRVRTKKPSAPVKDKTPIAPPPTYDTTGTGLTQEHFVYAYRLKVKVMNRVVVDPILLAKAVHAYGGIGAVVHGRLMQRVREGCGYPDSSDAANRLLKAFKYYFPTVPVPAPVRPIKNPKRKREDGDNVYMLSKKQKAAIKMAAAEAKAAAESSVLTSTSLVPFWSKPKILAIARERAPPEHDPSSWVGEHCARCLFGEDGVTIIGWVDAVVTRYLPPSGTDGKKMFRITHRASSTSKSAGLFAKRRKVYQKHLRATRDAMIGSSGGAGSSGAGGGDGGGSSSSSSSSSSANSTDATGVADTNTAIAAIGSITDDVRGNAVSELTDADGGVNNIVSTTGSNSGYDEDESLPPPAAGQDFSRFEEWLDRRKSDWREMRPKSWRGSHRPHSNQEDLTSGQLVYAVQLFHVRALQKSSMAEDVAAKKAQTMERVLAAARKQAEDDRKEAERVRAEKEAARLEKKKLKKEAEEAKRRKRIDALTARSQEQLLRGANMHAFGRWHLLCDGLPDLEELRDRLQNMKRTNANRRLRTLVDGVIAAAKEDAKAEASRRAANVGRPPKMKMPRKDHRSAKQRKRAAKEEKERLRSINELIKTEEHRLLEHKKARKSEALKREILEHATSLEFELQQLIIFLRRTSRQTMLMREAQADQEVRLAQLENLSSAVSPPASAAAVTVVPASQGNPRSFSRSELDTKLRRLSSGVILSQLILQDLNGWFFRPVSDLVPNYAKAISPALPSDFGTVWCRLVQKGYDDHPDQFAEDLRKIWQNCQLYNGKKAQVTLEAMRLASIFETNWAWLRGYSEDTPRAPPESDAVTYMDQENVESVKNDAVHLSSDSAPSSTPSSSAGISPPSPVSSTGANTNIVATPQKVSSNEEPHGDKSSDSEGVQAVSGGSAPVPKVGKSSPEKLWCQCDHCEKWHVVPPSIDLDSLPDQWYCSMNTWNPKDARCDFKKSMHQNLGGTAAVASPNEPQVQFGLKKSLGLGLAEEPFVLLGRGEWLAYAREIGRFASVSKKLTLPKRFLKGIEKLYVKVGGELAGRRG